VEAIGKKLVILVTLTRNRTMRLLLPAQQGKIDWSLFNRQISTKACLVGYTVHQLLAFHTNGTKENELTYLLLIHQMNVTLR